MKKTLTFLVCLMMIVSSLAVASAENAPLEINWLTWDDVNGFWSPDDVTITELQKDTNTKINFELVSRDN